MYHGECVSLSWKAESICNSAVVFHRVGYVLMRLLHASPSGVSPESIAIGSGNGMAGGNGTALAV